jgi:hypothetical protein
MKTETWDERWAKLRINLRITLLTRLQLLFSIAIRVIHKLRKTQQQKNEFGHTQGEIKKNLAKKYISIQLKKTSNLVVN